MPAPGRGRGRQGDVVGERGFEPPTPCSQSRCATRLRHSPVQGNLRVSGSPRNGVETLNRAKLGTTGPNRAVLGHIPGTLDSGFVPILANCESKTAALCDESGGFDASPITSDGKERISSDQTTP